MRTKLIAIMAAVCFTATCFAKDIKIVVLNTDPQMHCANCESKIKNNIRFEKGIKEIETNLADKTVTINEGGNLAASKIRNLECPSYEICLIDYGCGKFNRKIHIMEQYP